MVKKLAVSCGVLALLLYGQAQPEREGERRDRCISVGPSGALFCQAGTLDIVTAVVPRLMAANRFTGLNTFAQGVVIDTAEQRQPACQKELRGLFWLKKGERKDSMQVCILAEGKQYQWADMELRAPQ